MVSVADTYAGIFIVWLEEAIILMRFSEVGDKSQYVPLALHSHSYPFLCIDLSAIRFIYLFIFHSNIMMPWIKASDSFISLV